MERCVDFNECRKHFASRGRIKVTSSANGTYIGETFKCTICERQWVDRYIYQATVDISFHSDPPIQDETYGTVISEHRTIE